MGKKLRNEIRLKYIFKTENHMMVMRLFFLKLIPLNNIIKLRADTLLYETSRTKPPRSLFLILSSETSESENPWQVSDPY